MAESEVKKSFLLRIDRRLWDQLQAMAAQDLRSINAEIEFLLREAVNKQGRGGSARGSARLSAGESGDGEDS